MTILLAYLAITILLLCLALLLLKKALQRQWQQTCTALLPRFVGNRWLACLFGLLAAALLQSSTAVTISCIALTAQRLLTLEQSLAIVLGANIGTCSTVQLLSIDFLQGPAVYALLGGIAGLLFLRTAWRSHAYLLLGLLCLFGAFTCLNDGLQALTPYLLPKTAQLLQNPHPLATVAAGMLATVTLQSSSAATAITMALTEAGWVPLSAAAYIIYGNNLGSCLSPLLFGSLMPRPGRQLALGNLLLNLGGILCFWPFTAYLITTATWCSDDFAGQVAAIHTIFNLLSSVLLLPFLPHYAKLLHWLCPAAPHQRR